MIPKYEDEASRFCNSSATSNDKPTVIRKTSIFFKRCYKEISSFIYETPATVVGLIVAGIASIFFFPPLALPLFAIAGASLATKLATKIINRYDCKTFGTIESKIWGFHQSFGKWHMVAGLVAIAAGYFIPYAGIVVCLGYGLYNGLVMEMEQCKAIQEVKIVEQEGYSSNSLVSLGV